MRDRDKVVLEEERGEVGSGRKWEMWLMEAQTDSARSGGCHWSIYFENAPSVLQGQPMGISQRISDGHQRRERMHKAEGRIQHVLPFGHLRVLFTEWLSLSLSLT